MVVEVLQPRRSCVVIKFDAGLVSRGHMTWKKCPIFQKMCSYVLHVLFLSSAHINTGHGSVVVGSLDMKTDGKRTMLIVSVNLQSHGKRLVDKLCIFQSQSINQSINQNTVWPAYYCRNLIEPKRVATEPGPCPTVILF